MKSTIQFPHPRTLVVGKKYIAVADERPCTHSTTYEEVVFASYTSSPVMVIVTNTAGTKQKIERSAIYETAEKN